MLPFKIQLGCWTPNAEFIQLLQKSKCKQVRMYLWATEQSNYQRFTQASKLLQTLCPTTNVQTFFCLFSQIFLLSFSQEQFLSFAKLFFSAFCKNFAKFCQKFLQTFVPEFCNLTLIVFECDLVTFQSLFNSNQKSLNKFEIEATFVQCFYSFALFGQGNIDGSVCTRFLVIFSLLFRLGLFVFFLSLALSQSLLSDGIVVVSHLICLYKGGG